MRRIQHSIVCLLLLGLSAGASYALAPQHRTLPFHERSRVESPTPSGFLAALSDLFARVWGRTSCQIDPLGRCQPNQAPTAAPPAGGDSGSTGDTSCQIDPYGGCAASR